MFLPIPLWLLGFPPGLVFMRFFSLMSGSSLLDLFRLPILALFCSSLAYYSSIARTIQACKCKEKVTKGTVLLYRILDYTESFIYELYLRDF